MVNKLSQATIRWIGCATASPASRGSTTPSSPRPKTPPSPARGENSEVSQMSQLVTGASIYDVLTEGGGGVSPKEDVVREVA